MNKEYAPEEIKNRLSNIGEAVGNIALGYIADLEAQIEKMKCCGNCKYLAGKFDDKTHINVLFCKEVDMREIQVGFNMCCCKWGIKEK